MYITVTRNVVYYSNTLLVMYYFTTLVMAVPEQQYWPIPVRWVSL